jgi:phosphonate transport system substrate-binding protein
MIRSVVVALVALALVLGWPAHAAEPLSFAVLNQRNLSLTAQYWNPILDKVAEISGVALELRMGKTAPETTDMAVRGEFDLLYSNHMFTPERDALGYRVIARPATAGISGQIVTLKGSGISTLKQLEGSDVAFPSAEAFVGYWVTMDAILKAGITVTPSFAGNQEGAMAQMKAGRVVAASVNSEIMKGYAQREGIEYAVLWSSEPYLDIPVMVSPRVPAEAAQKVRDAFVSLAARPDGRAILEQSAALVQQKPVGFVAANDKDYENYRAFYRKTVVKAK